MYSTDCSSLITQLGQAFEGGHTVRIESKALEEGKMAYRVMQDGRFRGILRKVVPFYAYYQDCSSARCLNDIMSGFLSNSEGPSASASSSGELGTEEEVFLREENRAKVVQTFLKRQLSRGVLRNSMAFLGLNRGHLRLMKDLKAHSNTLRVAEAFNFDYKLVAKDPDFVSFVIQNSLHHKLGETDFQGNVGLFYASGLSIKYEGGKFLVPLERNGETEFVPYTKLSRDRKQKIRGYELMAKGFVKRNSRQATTMKPLFRVPVHGDTTKALGLSPLDIAELYDDKVLVELATAAPSYRLSSLGMGTFGHSWNRFYHLEKDKDGREFFVVYSLGYDLHNLRCPDFMDFAPRKRLSSRMPISRKEFDKKRKNFIEPLMRRANGRSKKKLSSDLEREFGEIFDYTKGGSCVNVATGVFNHMVGNSFRWKVGVPGIRKAPRWLGRALDRINQKLPKPFRRFVISKVQWITRAGFPAFALHAQTAFNRHQLNQRMEQERAALG